MRFIVALVLALGLLLCASCEEQSPAGLPVVKMNIGSRQFVLEVARTPAEQETGLMKRDSMPKDHGMIFVFPNDEVRKFWMKNTRFPLDIVFVGAKGRVVSISQMKAYDLNETSSAEPARYAIELNEGAAAEAGAKTGDVLEIPPAARSSN
jgi:hypothetical protein